VGMRLYCDCGFTFNEATVFNAAPHAQNAYRAANWRVIPAAVVTNTASNTYVRAPGTTQVSIMKRERMSLLNIS